VLGEGIPDYLSRKFKRRGNECERSNVRRGEQSRPVAPQVAASRENTGTWLGFSDRGLP